MATIEAINLRQGYTWIGNRLQMIDIESQRITLQDSGTCVIQVKARGIEKPISAKDIYASAKDYERGERCKTYDYSPHQLGLTESWQYYTIECGQMTCHTLSPYGVEIVGTLVDSVWQWSCEDLPKEKYYNDPKVCAAWTDFEVCDIDGNVTRQRGALARIDYTDEQREVVQRLREALADAHKVGIDIAYDYESSNLYAYNAIDNDILMTYEGDTEGYEVCPMLYCHDFEIGHADKCIGYDDDMCIKMD